VDISHRTDWWSDLVTTRVGYTYLHTEDRSEKENGAPPLKYRSKHTLYITNDFTKRPFSVGLDLRFLSQFDRIDEYHKVYIPDMEVLVPTYIASVRTGYSKEHFGLHLIIDNLFQYNYLVSPANIGPPRTAVLQLNLRF